MEPPIRNVGQRLPIQEEEQMLVGHRAPKHAPATRTHKQNKTKLVQKSITMPKRNRE